MPDITIGEGANKRRVTVGDEFLKLSPAEQQSTVNDIAKQLGVTTEASQPKPDADPEKRWRMSGVLPVEFEDQANPEKKRWERTGNWRINVGGFINNLLDPVRLPGEVMRGEVDPTSEEGFERTMGLAMMGVSPVKGTKVLPVPTTPKVAGQVTQEMREAVTGTKVGGEVTATKAYEGYTPLPRAKKEVPPPTGAAPSVPGQVVKKVVPTVTDDELNTLFAQGNFNYEQATRRISGERITAPGYENITSGTNLPRPTKPSMKNKDVLEVKGKESTGTVSWKGETWNLFNKFPPDKKFRLRTKQAERVDAAAKAGKLPEYLKELDKFRVLSGKLTNMSTQMKMGMDWAKDAISAFGGDTVKIEKFVQNVEKAVETPKGKANWMDMTFEVWVNSLLSSVQTQTVNGLSNALVKAWEHTENVLAAGVGKVLPGEGMTFKEVGARMVGDVESIGDALTAWGEAFVSEKDLFEDAGQWMESRRQLKAIPGTVGQLVRVPGRALTATDAFFKTMAYRQDIAGLAMREAMRDAEKLTPTQIAERFAQLKANPTEAMMEHARETAKYQTFSQGLGKAGKATQQFLRHSPFKFILPFYRTPVNLLKYSFERVPIANLAMRKVRDDFMGRNGVIARNQAIAKTTMGAAVGAYVFHEALKGNVSGWGPTDPAERSVWRANGNQPYSIRVGDTWYSYSRLEPLGTILGIAADAAAIAPNASVEEMDKITSLMVASIAQNVSNKTWLRGPIEFSRMLGNTDRYGAAYAQRMMGTIVPTALAQYARTEDPYLREVNSIMDAIKERMPGYRETLPIQRGVFGEPLRSQGGLGPDLVTPIYQTAAKNDPTIAEMLRLQTFPGRLQKKLQGTELTAEEWDYYSETTGTTVKKFSDMVVSSPVYGRQTDAMKKTLLEDVIHKAQDFGRTALKMKYPDLVLRIARNKAVERLALMPSSGAPILPPPEEQPAQPATPGSDLF